MLHVELDVADGLVGNGLVVGERDLRAAGRRLGAAALAPADHVVIVIFGEFGQFPAILTNFRRKKLALLSIINLIVNFLQNNSIHLILLYSAKMFPKSQN
jgi:hypothetical protein